MYGNLNLIQKPKKGRPAKQKTVKKSPTKLTAEEFKKYDTWQVRQKKASVKIYDVIPEYSTKVAAFIKGDKTTCWELIDPNDDCKTRYIPSKCFSKDQTQALSDRLRVYTDETEEKLAKIRAQQVTTGKVWIAEAFLGLERIAADPGNEKPAVDQEAEESKKRTLDQVTISDSDDERSTKRSKTSYDEHHITKQSSTSDPRKRRTRTRLQDHPKSKQTSSSVGR